MNNIVSLNAHVHSWECNLHGTCDIRFLLARIEEADLHFTLIADLNEARIGQRSVRHVICHREMSATTRFCIKSALCFDGPHMMTIVHALADHKDRAVATVIDGYQMTRQILSRFRARFERFSAPMPERGTHMLLPAHIEPPAPRAAARRLRDAALTNRSVVRPGDIGPKAVADDAFIGARISDAMPELLELARISPTDLGQGTLRPTLLEMRIAWITPLKPHQPVILISELSGANEAAIWIRNYLFEARSANLAATCDIATGFSEIKSGKRVPLAENLQNQVRLELMNSKTGIRSRQ